MPIKLGRGPQSITEKDLIFFLMKSKLDMVRKTERTFNHNELGWHRDYQGRIGAKHISLEGYSLNYAK